jgi:hypothetical protein
MLSTNNYLVVTPNNYFLCNDIRHIINSIKHSCYRLNSHQLQNFNKLITRHVERGEWQQPIKKQKYIIRDNIYVVKLTSDEIKMFF